MSFSSSSNGEDSDSDDGAYNQLLKQVTGKRSRVHEYDGTGSESESEDEYTYENVENCTPGQVQKDLGSGSQSVSEASESSSEEEDSADTKAEPSEVPLPSNDNFKKRFLSVRMGESLFDRNIAKSQKNRINTKEFIQSTKQPEESIFEHLKPRLKAHWVSTSPLRQYLGGGSGEKAFTPLQSRLFSTFNDYKDVLFSARREEDSFPSQLRDIVNLHIVNHIMKARDIVVKNNSKIKMAGIASKQHRDHITVQARVASEKGIKKVPMSAAEKERERKQRSRDKKKRRLEARAKANAEMLSVPASELPTRIEDRDEDIDNSGSLGNLRDQGFTRPRVLVLLPVRATAETFINSFLSVLPATISNIMNKRKFHLEFGLTEEEDEKDELGRRKLEYNRDGSRKPEDWIELFAKNNDDAFRIGISLARKTCKLYSDFYDSDIIIASPLGLRILMENDSDFLSSLEMIVIENASAILMQNWRHLQDIVEIANSIPTSHREGTDFSRVLPQFLNSEGNKLRQTIVFSDHMDVRLNSLMGKKCHNISGCMKVRQWFQDGEITEVLPKTKHLFRRIEVLGGPVNSDDSRFKYFLKNVFPRLRRICQGLDTDEEAFVPSQKNTGTMLFIPSYYDFLRLKKKFKDENLSPGILSEYSEPSEITRQRGAFYHGKSRLLLVTERFHHYNRITIRGVKNLIFYAPPSRFYGDLGNLVVQDQSSPQVTTLFTKYDTFQIESIVGSGKFKKMVNTEQDTFLFKFS